MDDEIKYVYGIDLGTTYSCIACIDKDGTPTVLKNVEGDDTTPSVVSFSDDNKHTVGTVAKNNAVIDPDKTVAFVKRLMGKSDTAIEYNGTVYSPAEISSYILKKVAGDAEKVTGQKVEDVVITVPAYFGDSERNATKIAGEYAHLNVLAVINEPTAAAISYGINNDGIVLVYDLGGGTFDVSIMKVNNGNVSEICHDGDDTLGGKDWDDALVKYIKDQFVETTNYSDEFEPEDEQDLLLKAEESKKHLSGKESDTVVLNIGGERAKIIVTRETFDSITKSLLDRTFDVVNHALDTAKEKGVQKSDITSILLVGGSTMMPQVEKAIIEKYNITPQIYDPNQAVAKGAAIYAYQCYKDNKGNPEPVRILPPSPNKGGSIIIERCTTKTYGIKLQRKTGEYYIRNLIIKNTTMPEEGLSVTEKYTILEDNTTMISLEIYECDKMEKEYDVIDPDYKLNTTAMELPPGLKAYEPEILTTFKMTKDGTLEISAIFTKDGKDYACNIIIDKNDGVEEYSSEKAKKLDGIARSE